MKGKQTKVELAASMIRVLAACHGSRRIDVVADAAYHGRALRDRSARSLRRRPDGAGGPA
ncbi:hypothetical protein AB0I98_42360 [Streptomyces sp. NPDC050211]|uniref:hypothetical protein n=1 Tax=Streptomyces sp. NPDC050211 TaxID=3154932 RepID=UPI003423D045